MKSLWSLFFLFCFYPFTSYGNEFDDLANQAIKRALLKDEESLIYKKAYKEALRDNKPLLIWIGMKCPKCKQEVNIRIGRNPYNNHSFKCSNCDWVIVY